MNRLIREGLTICEASGDQAVQSYFSINLGNLLCLLGHYAQAKSYIDDGIKISQELDNILGLGYGYRHRGEYEIAQGQYQQAIQTLGQSIKYFSEVGTVHASWARAHLGRAFLLKGDQVRAAQSFARSFEGFKLAESRLGLGECLNGLGALAREQGDLHQAEAYHREALAVWQDMGMSAEIAATRNYLGRVLVVSGEQRYAEARQYVREALELAAKLQLAPLALAICVDFALLRTHANQKDLMQDRDR